MAIERRAVLRSGALAVASLAVPRVLQDGSRPTRRESLDEAAVLVVWAGDALQDSVELAALTVGTTSVAAAVSPNPDMSGAVSLGSAPPDLQGWNRWQATGLPVGLPSYWQVQDTSGEGEPVPIGPIARFVTLQPAGVPCTIRRAIGSCTRSKGGAPFANPAAFVDIAGWAPDRLMHLGDLGYPQVLTRKTANHVGELSRQLQMPGVAEVLPLCCVDYTHSDHDTNGGNNLPNYKDPVTKASIRACEQMVPFRVTDERTPPHGVWRSEVEGRVRFVKLDYRSTDRTNSIGRSPTDPRSTMLGHIQLGWLESELAAAAQAGELVVLLSDTAWNGVCPDPVTAPVSDKMPAYAVERDHISDLAAQLGVDLVIVHGDTHLLIQDESHEKNGFVVIGGAPFDQFAQGHFQDANDWVYPIGQPETGGVLEVQQYQRLTWTDDGTVITLTAEAISCWGDTPGIVRTLTKSYPTSPR